MRNRIIYGQSYVLCSQPPSYQSNTHNVSGLKRTQGCSIDISFNRERFKQVGSEDFVGDVHLRNSNINLSLDYLYSNGTNEALIGLNVDGQDGHAAKYLKKENQDRNFYIIQGSGENNEPLEEDTFVGDYDVMGLGNCYLNDYSLNAQVGSPISVSASFSAYNAQIETYNEVNGKSIPAIDTVDGVPKQQYKYKILTGNIYDTTNLDSYMPAALSPRKIQLHLPSTINVPGLQFTGDQGIAHLQSMDVSFEIERHDLYGFGSMYPYGRRAKLPILGRLNFSAIASEFTTGTLHTIINSGELEFDFVFDFLDCSGATGLQLTVENAKIDRESFSEVIGDNASYEIACSFPISNTTGLRLSTPPLILDQPSGPQGTLSTTATGMSPITYKWYDASDDSEVGNGQSFLAGAQGNYYCVASNELGSGVSRTTYVSV